MRKILLLIFTLTLAVTISGQTPVGSWSDHLSYKSVNSIAVTADVVYASTGSSILSYNKTFAELNKMTRINGLSETSIKTIGWSDQTKTLIIGYTSTNVDLVKDNIVFNIPDISNKYISGKKEINKIRTNGNYSYLACSFGIVVTDLTKREIYDTWKPGLDSDTPEVWDIAFANGKIYAATDIGVYSGDLSNQGLAYFGNWHLIDYLPNPGGKYTSLVFSGENLYANLSESGGDQVFKISATASQFSYFPGIHNTSMDIGTSGFTISSPLSTRYYSPSGSIIKTINSYDWGVPDIAQAITDNNDIWIADETSGLIKGTNMSEFIALTLPGPASNNAFHINSLNGKTIIAGGAVDLSWTGSGRALQVSSFESNEWISFTNPSVSDPLRSLTDPSDINHFYISSWGGGLLEYNNNVLTKQYTDANSPLQTIIPGRPFVKICGMAMDKEKNLWITQTGVQGSLKILKPDGNWIVNPMTINAPVIGDIIITSTGQKWIILPEGHGLFVYDDNNTPDVFSDDKSAKLQVQDSENQIIQFVFSIAEDLDGSIWIGTDQGPMIYFNPERVFDTNIKASRIKIPRNDGTNLADYMLKTETITSIAIDGANRKWIGTENSGAYLLSPDGTSQIKSFNEKNSPLLSNSIISLAVDNKTGDVWLGSSKGIQSYRSDATTGAETFSKVYAFPNPVREDFTGNVTITGLIKDTEIRITDISGNLVYETISDGGLATWDLNNYKGVRVSTGVYLIFCASKDGSQSTVTKMLVIK